MQPGGSFHRPLTTVFAKPHLKPGRFFSVSRARLAEYQDHGEKRRTNEPGAKGQRSSREAAETAEGRIPVIPWAWPYLAEPAYGSARPLDTATVNGGDRQFPSLLGDEPPHLFEGRWKECCAALERRTGTPTPRVFGWRDL
jgi:hypothetical protein